MRRWSFVKGHGTENDFIVLLDRENLLDLGAEEVRYLCHRRAGIGADGVLRATLAHVIRGWTGDPLTWFMDYRNADGSIAEMCGNGIRVFARFLLDEGLVTGPSFEVATRGGIRRIEALSDGSFRVAMGPVRLTGESVTVTTADGQRLIAAGVDVGNPHAVSFVDHLDGLDLAIEPTWSPAEAYPSGVNREFVRVLGDAHVAMRVFERGSGETRSCGTGTVAAAAAAWALAGRAPLPVTYQVDIPGGTVTVELTDDQAFLTGPAVLVAHGEVAVPGSGPHRTGDED
jgi:diaminopimelate epimerase